MARDETYPHGGKRVVDVPVPMRALHRFTKPGGHVVEIRERRITSFEPLEWMEFIDDNLIESRMYHGGRLAAYAQGLQERVEILVAGGWTAEPTSQGAGQ